jgi:hypothetical protein
MRCSYPLMLDAAILGAVLLLPVILSGCSRQPNLVGKWSGSDPAAASWGSGLAAVTYDFHNDGLVEISAKLNKTSSTSSAPMASLLFGDVTNIHTAGTYTIKDDVLTITPRSLTLSDSKGQPPPFTPTIKQDPQINRYKISGATLTLNRMDGDKPLVLTRQKDAE